jgi:hypothetical protein
MTKLSPAAQAVLTAYRSTHLSINNLAAALRAAADKIPYLPKTPSEYDINVQDGREEVREKFLAIADELEAQ